MLRATDERDPLMAEVDEVDEVVDGQLSAEDVVDRDRAVRVGVTNPVDDQYRRAVPGNLAQCRVGRVHGRDQDSLATHDLVRYEPASTGVAAADWDAAESRLAVRVVSG